jgi:hypothetical protein
MSLYKTIFIRSLNEDNTAGNGGVFGDYTDGDKGYAPGDARVPSFLGAKKAKNKKKKRKSKQQKKLDISVSHAFPVQTRNGQSFGSFGTMSGFGS